MHEPLVPPPSPPSPSHTKTIPPQSIHKAWATVSSHQLKREYRETSDQCTLATTTSAGCFTLFLPGVHLTQGTHPHSLPCAAHTLLQSYLTVYPVQLTHYSSPTSQSTLCSSHTTPVLPHSLPCAAHTPLQSYLTVYPVQLTHHSSPTSQSTLCSSHTTPVLPHSLPCAAHTLLQSYLTVYPVQLTHHSSPTSQSTLCSSHTIPHTTSQSTLCSPHTTPGLPHSRLFLLVRMVKLVTALLAPTDLEQSLSSRKARGARMSGTDTHIRTCMYSHAVCDNT